MPDPQAAAFKLCILRGHHLNPSWPPDREIWRCTLGTVAKIGVPEKCISSFLRSIHVANGVCKDGISLLMFPKKHLLTLQTRA